MKKFLLLFITGALFTNISSAQTINTFAGNGTQGYFGDGGQATAAELAYPLGVAFDNTGNFYIADLNSCIRKVSASGIITTVVGNGVVGYSGDGGQATAAEVNYPADVVVDPAGNIYVADNGNNVIRKVNTSGIITTIAGNGYPSYSGDGGQATAAELNSPGGIVLDATGNIYVVDSWNNRIRKINTSGIITTVAGNGIAGYSGDGGQATAAEIDTAVGVAIDTYGNLYIGDYKNNCIRKITASGIISTFAGNGIAGFSGDGGAATSAELNKPAAIAFDASGNAFITDSYNERIRKVNTSGIISTLAGNGTVGYSGDGGPAISAELNNPENIVCDASSNIYFSDVINNVVRVINTLTAVTETRHYNETTVYPNPSNGVFQLRIRNEELGIKGQIEVYNMLGEQIYISSFRGGVRRTEEDIDLSSQPAGIYMYCITDAQGKLIKQDKITLAH